MKNVLYIIALLFSLEGISQTKGEDTVPAELLTNDSTYWTYSTLSTINYVNTQPGAYYGTTTNAGGMLGRYKFLPGNRYLFHLYVQVNSYGTRSETWTEVEGTVRFAKDEKGQDMFITNAEKGLYRIINNGKATKRTITEEELNRQHSGRFLWEKTRLKDDVHHVYLVMVDLKAHPEADADQKNIDPDWIIKFRIPAAR